MDNKQHWTPPLALMQTAKGWLQFTHPTQVWIAEKTADIEPILSQIAQARTHIVGFLTYEASQTWGYSTHTHSPLPFAWFAAFDTPTRLPELPTPTHSFQLTNWQPTINRNSYQKAIQRIKHHIAEGQTYQVNYTFPMQAQFKGDSYALFWQLAQNQRAQQMAYLDLGRFAICSASPELFFHLEKGHLLSRPMKGTAVRGLTLHQDNQQIEALKTDPKSQAENVMIVDMIRNDMSHIAQTGTVQVPRLFEVSRYPTLLQLTSDVVCQTTATAPDVLRAMFPCASITGAPKHRTMQLINQLEPNPRGIYTGSIGYIQPNGNAQFNVAIRTVTIDRQQEQATYHTGGGIIWDSDTQAEYEECLLKAQVLTRPPIRYELLETILWEPNAGYFLLTLHWQRLINSATYFNIEGAWPALKQELHEASRIFTQPMKVRVLLKPNGRFTIQPTPLTPTPQTIQLAIATTPIHSQNVWLYHKTTHRQVYQQAQAQHPQADDVLLYNEKGHLTEGCIGNIAFYLNGRWCTPPIEDGLLAGTMRQHLLNTGQLVEQSISIQQLQEQNLPLRHLNAVRKVRPATLFQPALSSPAE